MYCGQFKDIKGDFVFKGPKNVADTIDKEENKIDPPPQKKDLKYGGKYFKNTFLHPQSSRSYFQIGLLGQNIGSVAWSDIQTKNERQREPITLKNIIKNDQGLKTLSCTVLDLCSSRHTCQAHI